MQVEQQRFGHGLLGECELRSNLWAGNATSASVSIAASTPAE
jgi:hypothetical protein